MSIESGLLTAVVIALAIYLLAALILPERFQ
ncbi:K(+)-transporting ATPase subunit F [Aeromicrobium sp. 179-A 4D2 NHS]